jgi:addiction module RelB/DinJ family antitoxin
MNTTQINFRMPTQIKDEAQKKAEDMGMNLSKVLQLFLEKFVAENVVTYHVYQDVDLEKVFDQGVREYFLSEKGKQKIKEINQRLEDL